MRRIYTLIVLLGTGLSAPTLLIAAPASIICPVNVSIKKIRFVGQKVTITPKLSCPLNQAAYIRFRSDYGYQPTSFPYHFKLFRGNKMSRIVPSSWWVEERDRFMRWHRNPLVVP